jgi:hypothetical protein
MTTLNVITAFCYVLFFCFAIYVIRYYIDFVQIKKAKNDIALINAKIMALRMALRVRIKIKISAFRERFSKFIDAGDEIDRTLNDIAIGRYETGDEFQHYFTLSKSIVKTMKNDIRFSAQFKEMSEEHQGAVSSGQASIKFEEFCGPDYKNEIALVRIIKEITDANNKVSKKIQTFNHDNRNRKKFVPMQAVPPIQFAELADINKIFEDSQILLKQFQQSRSDFFHHAA